MENESNKQMTAVQWLEFEITRRGPNENNPPQWLKELYEQAKQMEKEQIEDAYFIGGHDIQNNRYRGMHEYYNETYGGNK
jgi:hypothetical protein